MHRFIAAGVGVGVLLSPANAWEIRARFAERLEGETIVLPEGVIDASNGSVRHIRLQLGVFDDAAGPAPVGGLAGWYNGMMEVTGPIGNSDERRAPGRLGPFNYESCGGRCNGVPVFPDGDPFTELTEIAGSRGTNTPFWGCAPDGTPLPMPAPQVLGLNSYTSVYAFTIDPNENAASYEVRVRATGFGVAEWRVVGVPVPPDCGDPNNPNDDVPGSVTYAPHPSESLEFDGTLRVFVPAPGTAALVGLWVGVVTCRRSRRP